MDNVKYDFGFMFKYSERPGTLAARKLNDNVPEEIKKRRLSEIIDLQLKHSFENLSKYVGKKVEVLIEKESKKSDNHWAGRNPQNIIVVFPKKNFLMGEYATVKIINHTSTTLIGEVIIA
jgi:tRNA-2-methylthio-N6-dimethylallyladenosine synthase